MTLLGEWWTFSPLAPMHAGTNATLYSFSAFSNGTGINNSSNYTLYLSSDISLSLSRIDIGGSGNRSGFILEYILNGVREAQAQLQHEMNSPKFNQSISSNVSLKEGEGSIFIPAYFGKDTVAIQTSLVLESETDNGDNTIHTSFIPSFFQVLPGMGISMDGEHSDTLDLWTNGLLLASAVDTAWICVMPYSEDFAGLSGVTISQDSPVFD